MPAKTLQTRIILRNDTKSAWESANPVLRKGEVGVVFDPSAPVSVGDTYVADFKIGDGVTAWNSLPLFRGPILTRLDTAEGKIATLEGQMAVVQGTVGVAGSIAKALQDAKDYADALVAGIDLSQIDLNKQAIATLNASAGVAGSVDYKVAQETSRASGAESALGSRLTTVEGAITTLNASAGVAGSVAASVAAETSRATGVESGLDTRLQTAEGKISALEGNHFIIVQTLPTVGLPNSIYLVPKTSPLTGYKEWLYVKVSENPDTYSWEEIGDTDIDLSDYYTKSEVNSMTATINASISAVSARVSTIEADYLKSVDTFILDCGNASTNISGS